MIIDSLGANPLENHVYLHGIVDVIQRIAEPLDLAFFELTMLLGHPVERVRQKAAEVIAALSSAGRSGTGSTDALAPDILAFMGGPEPKQRRRRLGRRAHREA